MSPPGVPAADGALARLGPLRHVRAGDLDVGYVEAGPDDGDVVVLLHGFPYDIHSYTEVIPRLAAAGRQVIVPYLRGHGPTRFAGDAAPRSGQQATIGADPIACWTRSASGAPPSPGTTGVAAPPASRRPCGRSAAPASCQPAAT